MNVMTSPVAASSRRDGTARQCVDVIGIGVQKAASTWLFRCLVEHPGIRAANRRGDRGGEGTSKEINFFNHYYERGYGWYNRLFEFDSWLTMEFSVLYFQDRNVPARIRQYNPGAKLILSLRNPIDRAFSQYKHEIRRGRVDPASDDFWAALANNPSYVEQGFYASALERWLEHFSLEQIHVIDYEDILLRPDHVLQKALSFIGLDPTFSAVRTKARLNSGARMRSPGVRRFLRHSSGAIRDRWGDAPVRWIRATGIPSLIRRHNRLPPAELPVAPLTAVERVTLGKFFTRENQRLGELLCREFSHWR